MNFPVAFTEMKKIPLTKGRVARVDSVDFDELNRHSWYYGSGDYACRGQGSWRKGQHKILYMHREVLNVPDRVLVDHKDRNGTNNRRRNLRSCTHAQNLRNHKINARNKTGFRGVSWDSKRKRFFASIRIAGKTIALGRFKTVLEAALARDLFAFKTWGEFASTQTL